MSAAQKSAFSFTSISQSNSDAAETPPNELSVNPFSRPATPRQQQKSNDIVGFIGAGGNMGQPMALNLAKHLHKSGYAPLKVWNRTKAKMNTLLEPVGGVLIAEECDDVKQMARECNIIITSLSSDEVVKDIYGQMFSVTNDTERRVIFVETSTLFPTTSGQLERTASSVPNRLFLAAPVFGPPPAAKDSQLVLVLAGQYYAKKKISHLLVPAIARKALDLGSNVEKAASFKLLGNSVILSMIEVLAESFVLAEKSGVGADVLYDWCKEFLPAPSIINYGSKILNQSYSGTAGFTLDGGIKDASHIRKLAEQHNTPMPIIDIAHQHLVTARANGGRDLDWSALAVGARISAGLHPFETKPLAVREEHLLERDSF